MATPYSDEFKREAIRLVGDGSSIRQIAEDLGINEWTLRGWVKRAKPSDRAPRPAATLEEENRRLREENQRLKLEREILKRATAFFASEKP